MKMLNHSVTSKLEGLKSNLTRQLSDSLVQRVREQAVQLESISVMTIPTLLDPRLKKLGFLSQGKLQEGISRLKSESEVLVSNLLPPIHPQLSCQPRYKQANPQTTVSTMCLCCVNVHISN